MPRAVQRERPFFVRVDPGQPNVRYKDLRYSRFETLRSPTRSSPFADRHTNCIFAVLLKGPERHKLNLTQAPFFQPRTPLSSSFGSSPFVHRRGHLPVLMSNTCRAATTRGQRNNGKGPASALSPEKGSSRKAGRGGAAGKSVRVKAEPGIKEEPGGGDGWAESVGALAIPSGTQVSDPFQWSKSFAKDAP